MILKGSQRGGAAQLAWHLLRTDENEHVTVEQVRGFVSNDLRGALAEAEAISNGTKCKQFLFSLSLNPPKDGDATKDQLIDAADRAEEKLGLSGHPRCIVIHEKGGRRHAHAVWSRIDPENMKAVNLPYFKMRLAELSKELYLEHGWELPAGHRGMGWANPLNFTLAEWQQAKRLDLDPRLLKQLFRDAWAKSDNLATFKNALAERGFFLAKGDRRAFVAVDVRGEVFSVARMVGIKTRELEARLGSPDQLSHLNVVKAQIQERVTANIRTAIRETQRAQRRESAPLRWRRRQIVRAQRAARVVLGKAIKDKKTRATGARAMRLKDVPSLRDLGGRLPFIRNQNEHETYEEYRQYRRAIERLYEEQMDELRLLQRAISQMRTRQQAEQLAMIARMATLMNLQRDGERNARENRPFQLALEF